MKLDIEKVERDLSNFQNKRESEVLNIMDDYAMDMFTNPYDEPRYLKTNQDAYIFIRDMIRDKFEVWFIKDDDKVIGFMGYYPSEYSKVAEIFIAFSKDYRGIRAGREFIGVLEEILIDKNYRKIKAETVSFNGSCQHILECNGFELEGIIKKEKKLGDEYCDTFTYGKFINIDKY